MRPKRGTIKQEDALELLDRQDRVLEELFERWRGGDGHDLDPGQQVEADWRKGTTAKLILEQGALRVAALEEVIRCLRRCHQDHLGAELGVHLRAAKVCLDRIDESSKGVTPLDLRYSDEVRDSIATLRELWADDIRRGRTALPAVAGALGDERHRLHSARFVRAHAPLHPSAHRRWYHRLPLLVRLQALYELARSFPDAESKTFAAQAVSRRVDHVGHSDV
jgi:hypothetical protein